MFWADDAGNHTALNMYHKRLVGGQVITALDGVSGVKLTNSQFDDNMPAPKISNSTPVINE